MLLFLIVLTIVILLIIASNVKNDLSRKIAYIYSVYWMTSLILCKVNPFGYFPVSDKIYYILAFHVVTFIIGFAITKCRNVDVTTLNLSIDSIFKSKIFILLYIVSTLFAIVLLARQWRAMAAASLMNVRGDFMAIVLEGSGLAYLYYCVVATCFYHFCLAIVSYMLFFDRRWKIIGILSIYIVVFASIGGGRSSFMTFAYYGLGVFLLSNIISKGREHTFKLPLKLKVFIGIAVVFITVAMSFVTAFRNGHTQFNQAALEDGFDDLMMTFGEYSAGPIVAFDQAMNDLSAFNPGNKRHYGTAMISEFDYFWWVLFHKYGLHETTSYDTTTSILQHEFMTVSPDRHWNYAYTSCMYYYYDFGWYGILFIPFLLGIITRKCLYMIENNINIYTIAFFIVLTICLYMSIFSGYLQKMNTLFYFITMYIMSSRSSRKLTYKN